MPERYVQSALELNSFMRMETQSYNFGVYFFSGLESRKRDFLSFYFIVKVTNNPFQTLKISFEIDSLYSQAISAFTFNLEEK